MATTGLCCSRLLIVPDSCLFKYPRIFEVCIQIYEESKQENSKEAFLLSDSIFAFINQTTLHPSDLYCILLYDFPSICRSLRNGHTHYRRNKYHAQVTFVTDDDSWKIKDIELVDEERLL